MFICIIAVILQCFTVFFFPWNFDTYTQFVILWLYKYCRTFTCGHSRDCRCCALPNNSLTCLTNPKCKHFTAWVKTSAWKWIHVDVCAAQRSIFTQSHMIRRQWHLDCIDWRKAVTGGRNASRGLQVKSGFHSLWGWHVVVASGDSICIECEQASWCAATVW